MSPRGSSSGSVRRRPAQVQQGRDEVMLEFFTDEVGRNEDALMEMSFFVPRDNDRYGGDGDNPACKVGPSPSWLALFSTLHRGPRLPPSQTLPMLTRTVVAASCARWQVSRQCSPSAACCGEVAATRPIPVRMHYS